MTMELERLAQAARLERDAVERNLRRDFSNILSYCISIQFAFIGTTFSCEQPPGHNEFPAKAMPDRFDWNRF